MDDKELREHLQNIRNEIDSTQATDGEGSRLLQDLDADIRAYLDRPEGDADPLHPFFIQRLQGALYHFEATHPNLTSAISSLLNSLSSSGI